MNIDQLMPNLPKNVGSALIITPENRRYFTDFESSDGFLLVTRDGSIFFTDSRYIEAAGKTINCCEVREGKTLFTDIEKFLKERNIGSIAVEASGMTVVQYNNLAAKQELSDFDLICSSVLDDAINELRSIKSREEVENIKAAQAIAEDAFLHILGFIKPGVTEKDIQLELDYFMLRNGAEKLSFDTIAVSGVNSSMPHGVPTDKKIENGDFITMDFGAVVNGYHSDMTRTVAVGHVSDEQKIVYETVLRAQKAAIGAVKAGVSCVDGDAAARNIINEAGYGGNFGHGTGHGVGIEIHEYPNLSPKSKAVLKTGHIVTVEPGIYIPGKFGVRIEDMVYITENGCVDLTNSDKNLIIL